MTPDEVEKYRRAAKALELNAPKSFWSIGPDELAPLVGGCGPGPVGDKLVPDHIYGLNITPCCVVHDYGWLIAKNRNDRNKADLFFLMNMLKTNLATPCNWCLKIFRKYRAFHYYLAVSEIGLRIITGNKKDLLPK